MAFTPMEFNPVNGLRDTATYPKQPSSEAEIRDAIQDQSDQLRDYINNTFIPALGSTEADGSGADNIGSGPIEGVTGTTIQAKLAALKALIDAISISASGLTDGVVVTQYLADLAVTAAKLAADAVETIKIKDGAVTTEKIADDAVTQDKIADNAVGANQIANGAVSQDKLAAGAVVASKIATGLIGGYLAANVMKRGSTLAADANYNDITEVGIYQVYNGSGHINGPGITHGVLIVTNAAYIKQEVFAYDGSVAKVRYFDGQTTWTPWYTQLESNLTPSRVLVSDANGKVSASTITDTELGYLHAVTSSIQGQLNTIFTWIDTHG
jgi:hypothetical protein